VFATDCVLDHVSKGMTFRNAYDYVKDHLHELEGMDPYKAIAGRKHMGGTAGLDFGLMISRISAVHDFIKNEKKRYAKTISRLLRVPYPFKN